MVSPWKIFIFIRARTLLKPYLTVNFLGNLMSRLEVMGLLRTTVKVHGRSHQQLSPDEAFLCERSLVGRALSTQDRKVGGWCDKPGRKLF